MRRPTRLVLFTVIAVACVSASCGPEETPEQKVERLRFNHEIYPVGTTTLHDDEGNPTLLVDLNVANQGTEPLPHLTVMVRVRGGDGKPYSSYRKDTDNDAPGCDPPCEWGAGCVAGTCVAQPLLRPVGTVEIEPNLPPETLRALPEFADVAG